MFRSLSPGAIGASVENLADGLELAARHGFAGYRSGLMLLALFGWWLSSRRKKDRLQGAESYLSEAESALALGDRANVTLGRSPANAEFIIDHEEVFREHGRLTCVDGELYAEDLKALNGTKVNGRLLNLVFFCVALLLPGRSVAEPDFAALEKSVVRIVAHGRGTGFAINNQGHIATNFHVIADGNSIDDPIKASPTNSSRWYAVEVVAISRELDLAIAHIPITLPPIVLSLAPLEKGQKVWSMGYPGRADRNRLAHDPSVHKGVIGRIEKGSWKERKERWYTRKSRKFTIIQHSASTNPGNSGGPLLDDCGRAIGVNTRASLDVTTDSSGAVIRESYATGLYWSSHIGELANLLDDHRIAFQSESTDCVAAGGTGSSGEAEKARREAEKARRERVKTEEVINQFSVQINQFFVFVELLFFVGLALFVLVFALKKLRVKRNAPPLKPQVRRRLRRRRFKIAALVAFWGGIGLLIYLNEGKTPLHYAAIFDASSVAEVLLRQEAAVNAKDNKGKTPLHYAAYVDASSMAEVLLRQGAAVNAKDDNGWTPLHHAAQSIFDASSVAEVLLRQEAAVNAKDNKGRAPLHVAAYVDASSMAEVLLSQGAAVNAKDNKGRTPLHVAAQSIFDASSMAEVLLSQGAAVNAKDNYGRTPLHHAAQSIFDASSMAEVLLSQGAAINAKDNNGWTPLHVAVQEDASSMAEFLLSQEAAVNAKDNNGWTPLHWAEYEDASSMAKVLRLYGARR